MKTATLDIAETSFGLGEKLWMLIKDTFRTDQSQQAAIEQAAPETDLGHVANLLFRIDNGDIVEETGERARIPRFARVQLKTPVETGGMD